MALSGALVSVLVAGDAAAGVELASTFVLRGRRGTWRQALAFCVAGVTWRSLFVTQLLDTPRPPLSPAARLSHTHNTTLSHTIFHTQLCQPPSFTHPLSHTTFTHNFFTTHTHIIFLCHTPTFICNFVTTTSTTSFVFPSFPVPATTFGAHDWTKLTCGVIRSFNCFSLLARPN